MAKHLRLVLTELFEAYSANTVLNGRRWQTSELCVLWWRIGDCKIRRGRLTIANFGNDIIRKDSSLLV